MKNLNRTKVISIAAAFAFLGLFVSCIGGDWTDTVADTTSAYTPMLMERDQLEKAVIYKTGQEMVNPGKIYIYGNTLFMSDRYNGVHIIDNSNPREPKKTGYIRVPGCVDMAVKQNIMYLDNAVDLIAIDLDKLPEIVITSRVRNVFPDLLPPDANTMPEEFLPANRPANTIIVGWKKVNASNK